IRKIVEHNVADLPVRASFLAHISLELLLDHKLIANDLLSVSRLYEHLEHSDRTLLSKYLLALGIDNQESFFKFYDRFVASKYIYNDAEVENLPHALFNICKRVCDCTPSPRQFEGLAQQLYAYQKDELKDYIEIYSYISQHLD